MGKSIRVALVSILVTSLGVAAARAAPRPVTVQCVVHGDTNPEEIRLQAEGKGKLIQVIAHPVQSGEFAGRFDLDETVSWRVSALADGFWAEPASVLPSQQSTVRLHLWREGMVKAKVSAGDTSARSLVVKITLWTSPEAPGEQPRLEGESFQCSVRGTGALECGVPAGIWDVSVRAEGHVSHYFWGVRVTPDSTHDFGPLRFRKGASVVGWLASQVPGLSFPSCTVKLVTFRAGELYDDQERRIEHLAASVTPNTRGFFHFAGIMPGRYVIFAEGPGAAHAEVGPFDVYPNAESALPEPVVLEPPASITVSVDPPTDPWSRTWTLRLDRDQSAQAGRVHPVGGGEVSPSGSWSMAGLAPGSYSVVVRDGEGATWLHRRISLVPGENPVFLDMNMLEICGEVKLGDDPVLARLEFRERLGDAQHIEGSLVGVPLETDRSGRFSGWLPHPGQWVVLVRAASWHVHRQVGPIDIVASRSGACVDASIDLPDQKIAGVVVDPEDRPTVGARVSLFPVGTSPEVMSEISAADGSFQFRGLDPGRYRISARKAGREAPVEFIELAKGQDRTGVKLVLRETRRIRGVVTSSFGPVAGAMVMAFSAFSSGMTPATTGADGSFDIEVPGQGDAVQLVVAAPGFCLFLSRLDLVEHGGEVAVTVRQDCGDIMLHGPDNAVHGSVVLFTEGGAWLPGNFFRAWNPMNGTPSTRAGEFPLARLEPGRYRVCVAPVAGQEATGALLQGSGGGGKCEDVFVTPGSSTDVAFQQR